MSYESDMLARLAMPAKKEVADAILITLFRHNGLVKDFSTGEDVVNEIAALFSLSSEQRQTVLERIYRKDNRIVRTPLWHRLLFRAADTLANAHFVTRPTETAKLTGQREWMLTEKGFDAAAALLKIPAQERDMLLTKSYEVQQAVNEIERTPCPDNYSPIGEAKTLKTITRETRLRSRVFRQSVIENYDFQCCICGLKIKSPDNLSWEVEAAHIVPHTLNGRDDVWNGVALCRIHHWAFDVGWFSFDDDYRVMLSTHYEQLPENYGKIYGDDFLKTGMRGNQQFTLPKNRLAYPSRKALEWHRTNVYHS